MGLAHLSCWKLTGTWSFCFFYGHVINAWFRVCKSCPVIFAALYEPAQLKRGIWHCSGLLLAAGESLISVELSAEGCSGLCTTQARYSDPPGPWHDSLAQNLSHQWLPQLQRAQDKTPTSYNQSRYQEFQCISAMPGLTLNLLNGIVLQILGNKPTLVKDRSSPEILSITALVNWEMLSQPQICRELW